MIVLETINMNGVQVGIRLYKICPDPKIKGLMDHMGIFSINYR